MTITIRASLAVLAYALIPLAANAIPVIETDIIAVGTGSLSTSLPPATVIPVTRLADIIAVGTGSLDLQPSPATIAVDVWRADPVAGVSPVPEPESVWLALSGIALIALRLLPRR